VASSTREQREDRGADDQHQLALAGAVGELATEETAERDRQRKPGGEPADLGVVDLEVVDDERGKIGDGRTVEADDPVAEREHEHEREHVAEVASRSGGGGGHRYSLPPP
jgi:hypothetical protein